MNNDDQDLDTIIDEIFEHGKDDGFEALCLLLFDGQTDGAHHKQWVIDQAVRRLAGPYYEKLIAAYCNNGEYEWDVGIAP